MSGEKIGSSEFRTRFSEILRRASAGESFVITNRGRPVADIVPSSAASGRKARAAVDNILRMSKTVAPVSDERLARYRRQGRG